MMPYYRHRLPVVLPDLAFLRVEMVFAPENVDRFIVPLLSSKTTSVVISLQS